MTSVESRYISNQVYWIFWFISVGISVLYGFWALINLNSFIKIRRAVVIKQRYPKLIILETIFIIIALFGERGLNAAVDAEFNELSIKTYNILDILVKIIYPLIFYGIADIEATRIWLMYFKIKYLHATKTAEWKVLIDKTVAQNDWYINKKVCCICINSICSI